MLFANQKIANYVRKNAVFAMLGAAILLWALNVSLGFLGELNRIKEGYTFLQALKYIFLRSPQYLYEFLPMATLVGAVVGLGNLASKSELTVMRAAGISLYRIVYWVVQAVVVLVILSLVMSQYVLPHSNAAAHLVKHPDAKVIGEVNGFWIKDSPKNNTENALSKVVYVDYANADGKILDVTIWQIDDNENIHEVTQAKTGNYVGQGMWQLNNVSTTAINANASAKTSVLPSSTMKLPLAPNTIYLMTRSVSDLSISDLYHFNQQLSLQGKRSAEHQLAFWQKLLSPLAFLSLAVIACSFVFGSLRQQSMGLRIVMAILCGMIFRYIQDLTAYMGLVYDTSPIWFVLLPIIFSGILGFLLLKRKR